MPIRRRKEEDIIDEDLFVRHPTFSANNSQSSSNSRDSLPGRRRLRQSSLSSDEVPKKIIDRPRATSIPNLTTDPSLAPSSIVASLTTRPAGITRPFTADVLAPTSAVSDPSIASNSPIAALPLSAGSEPPTGGVPIQNNEDEVADTDENRSRSKNTNTKPDRTRSNKSAALNTAPRHNRYFHHDHRVTDENHQHASGKRSSTGLYSQWEDDPSPSVHASSTMPLADGIATLTEGGRRRHLYDYDNPDQANALWSHDKFDELQNPNTPPPRNHRPRFSHRGRGTYHRKNNRNTNAKDEIPPTPPSNRRRGGGAAGGAAHSSRGRGAPTRLKAAS